MQSVAITGIGLVTPLGLSLRENVTRLRGLDSCIGRLDRFEVSEDLCQASGAVRDFPVNEGLRRPKQTKFMNRGVQFAMRSALEAMASSGFTVGQIPPERIGIYVGSGQTGMEPEQFLGSLSFAWQDDSERDYKSLGGRPSRLIDRYFSLRTLSNGGVGMLSVELEAKGPSANYVHSETAAVMALHTACYDLLEGRCDVAVAGGYDSLLLPTVWGDYQRAGMLSTDPPEVAYRPFDVSRSGLVPGEGAGFFVLERRESVEVRGARVYGELIGLDCGGDGIERQISRLIDGNRIDFVVARGLGTVKEDACELRELQNVLPQHVPVTALKSRTGYLGAATAAVELALGLSAAAEGFLPAIARLENPEPDCHLDLVMREPRRVSTPACGLFLSRSLMGTTGVIVAKAYPAAS